MVQRQLAKTKSKEGVGAEKSTESKEGKNKTLFEDATDQGRPNDKEDGR